MKRREFITLLGGAAAALPLAARAQQAERMRRIGVLMTRAADDPQSRLQAAAFQVRLQEFGWTNDANIRIGYRWGGGDVSKYKKYAAELVTLAPDVIVAVGGTSVEALQEVTRAVPIVFVQVTDPVNRGLVASLARPHGNTTGFLQFEFVICGKWLELLKQIAPRGGPAPPRSILRNWPDGRHPVGAAGLRDRAHSYRPARSRCDRAGPQGVCARGQPRDHRDGSRQGGNSPRSDHRLGGSLSMAGGLPLPDLCGGGRPHLLWP